MFHLNTSKNKQKTTAKNRKKNDHITVRIQKSKRFILKLISNLCHSSREEKMTTKLNFVSTIDLYHWLEEIEYYKRNSDNYNSILYFLSKKVRRESLPSKRTLTEC